jgi:sugar (pentulose or hexulose) kinase
MQGNLTNEVGAFGRITLLRNNAGMFINQRLKPEYEAETGTSIGWTEFSELALQHEGDVPLFDVNDVRFFNPVSMSGAIREYLMESGQTSAPADWPTVVRSYQVSLACSYAQVCAALEGLSGKKFPVVYLAGGGSRNILQNRTVADVLGRPVITGSNESTSLGCLAAQLPQHEAGIDIRTMRKVIRSSIETREFVPEQDLTPLAERYIQQFAAKGV